ncbi:MAG: cation diffusion facilitator family transporter [Rhodocyclaceae bacterium]
MADDFSASVQAPLDPARYRAAQRSTWVSVAVNILLTLTQVGVGLLTHAQSLVADGIHSASDLLADFFVLYANRRGSHPADPEHPYGHGRFETAASLVLGALLAGTGVALLISAGARLQNVEHLPDVQPLALWVALGTLAAKEGLFRYMLAVAERLRSPLLVANAWHARSDAASSLVVAAGIGGSLLGYKFLDLLAATIVGFLILRMGWKFAFEALRELIDTGLDEESVGAIRTTLLDTQGVIDLHELRTRRMGHQALVDAHIRVDPRISVSEGHRIAEHARYRVLKSQPDVLDVLVHVDAEDDSEPAPRGAHLPGRAELMDELAQLLGAEVPQAQRPLLHYLGNRIEAEVFLPQAYCLEGERLTELETRIRDVLPNHPYFRAISIHCRIAPH